MCATVKITNYLKHQSIMMWISVLFWGEQTSWAKGCLCHSLELRWPYQKCGALKYPLTLHGFQMTLALRGHFVKCSPKYENAWFHETIFRFEPVSDFRRYFTKHQNENEWSQETARFKRLWFNTQWFVGHFTKVYNFTVYILNYGINFIVILCPHKLYF